MIVSAVFFVTNVGAHWRPSNHKCLQFCEDPCRLQRSMVNASKDIFRRRCSTCAETFRYVSVLVYARFKWLIGCGSVSRSVITRVVEHSISRLLLDFQTAPYLQARHTNSPGDDILWRYRPNVTRYCIGNSPIKG